MSDLEKDILKIIGRQLSCDDEDSMMPEHKFKLWFDRVQEVGLLASIAEEFYHHMDDMVWAELMDKDPTIEEVVAFIDHLVSED